MAVVSEGWGCSSGMLAICLQGSCPAGQPKAVCVCSGAGQLSKKLRTQPPSEQSEKRYLVHSWNEEQEKLKTESGQQEEDKASQVHYCSPGKLPPTPVMGKQ